MRTKDLIMLGAGYTAGRLSKKTNAGLIGTIKKKGSKTRISGRYKFSNFRDMSWYGADNYMSGMVHIKNADTIINLSRSIYEDLYEEGFDKNEISSFLSSLIRKALMK